MKFCCLQHTDNPGIEYLEPLEIRHNVLGRAQHRGRLRSTHAITQVAQVVCDPEQGAARRNRPTGLVQNETSLSFGHLQIAQEHKIVEARAYLEVREICHDPFHVRTPRAGESPAFLDADTREVHRRDLPALLGQPDGISPLASG